MLVVSHRKRLLQVLLGAPAAFSALRSACSAPAREVATNRKDALKTEAHDATGHTRLLSICACPMKAVASRFRMEPTPPHTMRGGCRVARLAQSHALPCQGMAGPGPARTTLSHSTRIGTARTTQVDFRMTSPLRALRSLRSSHSRNSGMKLRNSFRQNGLFAVRSRQGQELQYEPMPGHTPNPRPALHRMARSASVDPPHGWRSRNRRLRRTQRWHGLVPPVARARRIAHPSRVGA